MKHEGHFYIKQAELPVDLFSSRREGIFPVFESN